MTYYLNSAGADSIAVMAALRSSFRISLGAANSLIANIPSALPVPADGDMESAVERLRRAGATVDTVPVSAAPEPEPEQPQPEPEIPAVSFWDSPSPAESPVQAAPAAPVAEPSAYAAPAPDPVVSAAPAATSVGAGYYTVYLQPTPAKLVLVKEVKELTGWGLKEAKEWVDEAPNGGRTFEAAYAFGIRDKLAEAGFRTRLVAAGASGAPKAAPVQAPAPSVINKITITDPGSKRMQIIPLLKKELRMNYSSAANLAEKGGDITSFPDAATAARVADALRALGATITLA